MIVIIRGFLYFSAIVYLNCFGPDQMNSVSTKVSQNKRIFVTSNNSSNSNNLSFYILDDVFDPLKLPNPAR